MKTAAEILRAHVVERHLREAVRSARLDEEPDAITRLGHDAWVTSCGLTAGVPEDTLRLLEHYYCGSNGSIWETVLCEVAGAEVEVRDEQAPVRLTLAQAAERAGLGWSFAQARAAKREAEAIVVENLVRRASREETP